MPWYENFFHGLTQDAWKAAQTDDQTRLDLEWLVETLEFGPDDRLLDVFCGYGRHALPLARMGCSVVGVDISDEYTAELRGAARRDNLPVETVSGDFLTAPLTGLFDAGYCLGNSFSFFPRPVMLAFLRRIADLLKPGGRFLAHTGMIAESVLPDFQERTWMPLADNFFFLAENEYDPLESRMDSHLTYLKNGKTETRLAQHYLYTLGELRHLFREAGFAEPTCFGDTDGRAYELGDTDLWLLAERR
ncbi:MAG: methyltransferase domain-containing protein [Bacteroidetes bacterium]|nr:methyltransferase domain-containing protein [Fibrella sp.]